MTLTFLALKIFLILLLLSLILAGISYHFNVIKPLWNIVYILNKLSVLLIPLAVIADFF